MVNVNVYQLRNIRKVNTEGYEGEIYTDFDHVIILFDWAIAEYSFFISFFFLFVPLFFNCSQFVKNKF